MTREEAIYTIERLAHTEAKWPGTEDTLEALDLALSALRPVSREQVEKVWRGEWIHAMPMLGSGDEEIRCSECGNIVGFETDFCPNCGAAMTDEAVQMVMERLEALKDGMVYYIEEAGGEKWIGNKPIQQVVLRCGFGMALLEFSLFDKGKYFSRAEAEAALRREQDGNRI